MPSGHWLSKSAPHSKHDFVSFYPARGLDWHLDDMRLATFSLLLSELNRELQDWKLTCYTVRCHQVLGYLIPWSSSLSLRPKKRNPSATNLLEEVIGLISD